MPAPLCNVAGSWFIAVSSSWFATHSLRYMNANARTARARCGCARCLWFCAAFLACAPRSRTRFADAFCAARLPTNAYAQHAVAARCAGFHAVYRHITYTPLSVRRSSIISLALRRAPAQHSFAVLLHISRAMQTLRVASLHRRTLGYPFLPRRVFAAPLTPRTAALPRLPRCYAARCALLRCAACALSPHTGLRHCLRVRCGIARCVFTRVCARCNIAVYAQPRSPVFAPPRCYRAWLRMRAGSAVGSRTFAAYDMPAAVTTTLRGIASLRGFAIAATPATLISHASPPISRTRAWHAAAQRTLRAYGFCVVDLLCARLRCSCLLCVLPCVLRTFFLAHSPPLRSRDGDIDVLRSWRITLCVATSRFWIYPSRNGSYASASRDAITPRIFLGLLRATT